MLHLHPILERLLDTLRKEYNIKIHFARLEAHGVFMWNGLEEKIELNAIEWMYSCEYIVDSLEFNTLVSTLFHELGHMVDYRTNKYTLGYYSKHPLDYNNYIIEAEKSADRTGKRLMKQHLPICSFISSHDNENRVEYYDKYKNIAHNWIKIHNHAFYEEILEREINWAPQEQWAYCEGQKRGCG